MVAPTFAAPFVAVAATAVASFSLGQSIYEAATGRDWATGEPLNDADRIQAGTEAFLGIGSLCFGTIKSGAFRSPRFPHDPGEMGRLLGGPGRQVADLPGTLGRGKTTWKLADGSELRHEAHPYYSGWAEEAPHYQTKGKSGTIGHGLGGSKFFPGDKIPSSIPIRRPFWPPINYD